MNNIVTLSGWGHPADALKSIAPQGEHVDYGRHATVSETFAELKEKVHSTTTLVGWSLGGQLAVRAVAAGAIKPKHLVLIASPFQYVQNPALKLGLSPITYQQFHQNCVQDQERALKKAYALVAKEDMRANCVEEHLNHNISNVPQHDWVKWLEHLADFSCKELEFTDFPPTTIIHGLNDAVSEPEHSEAFHAAIPNSTLHFWQGCGHAPQWHNAERMKHLLAC